MDFLTAALVGNIEIVEGFIADGALNVEDEDGYTPLHNAISRKHHEVAKQLIPLVNVNKQSKSGFTPLMNAAAYGDNTMICMLLDAGADVGMRNIYGETAYDVAAMAELLSTCELIQKAETDWIRRHYARESNLQLRSHSSIQERLHCNFLEVIHENQRFSLFNYNFSGSNLTESDIGLIGGTFSTTFGRKKGLDEVLLPSSSQFEWFWLTEWKVDLLYPKADENGWLYASGFEVPDDSWGIQITPNLFSRSTFVRRRKWIRVRKRRISLNEPALNSSGSDNNLLIATGHDYIAEAVEIVQSSSPKRRNSSASIKGLNAELEVYDEAIRLLLKGLKTEKVSERQERAKSLADSYIRHADTLRSLLETLKSSQSSVAPENSNLSVESESLVSNNNYGSAVVDSFLEASPREHFRSTSQRQFLPAPWQPDDQAFDCSNCEKLFTFFVRKHHCRWCGQIFCNACSLHRVSLSVNSYFRSRVCQECHAYLTSYDSPVPHLVPQLSPIRNDQRSSLNGLVECPVCQISLRNRMNDEEATLHLSNCLSNADRVKPISGNMYIIQELKEDLDLECIICLEPFSAGEKIARLNCLCFYHQNCFEKWLSNPNYGVRSCPVHYI